MKTPIENTYINHNVIHEVYDYMYKGKKGRFQDIRRNNMYNGDRELIFRRELKKYKTKEEKLDYLKECRWQIELIDRWNKENEKDYDIVNKLIKEVEENER